MNEQTKIVVVPCRRNAEGRIDSDRGHAPYGYHHIIEVHHDGSGWPLATVFVKVNVEKLAEIAKIIADGKPVETDPDYYEKRIK